MMDFIDLIKQAADKKIIYTNHALNEMNAEDELITTDEVRYVIFNGEIIEDYLAIITVYIPTLKKWGADFRTRRKKK